MPNIAVAIVILVVVIGGVFIYRRLRKPKSMPRRPIGDWESGWDPAIRDESGEESRKNK